MVYTGVGKFTPHMGESGGILNGIKRQHYSLNIVQYIVLRKLWYGVFVN